MDTLTWVSLYVYKGADKDIPVECLVAQQAEHLIHSATSVVHSTVPTSLIWLAFLTNIQERVVIISTYLGTKSHSVGPVNCSYTNTAIRHPQPPKISQVNFKVKENGSLVQTFNTMEREEQPEFADIFQWQNHHPAERWNRKSSIRTNILAI